MSDPTYLVRLFDARRESSTAGRVCWLKRPGNVRAFVRDRAGAHRFESRGQAERAIEGLPALYEPIVEEARP